MEQEIILPSDFIKPAVLNTSKDYGVIRAGMRYGSALRQIESKKPLVAEGSFATSLSFYSWLKKQIIRAHPVFDHRSSRIAKGIIRERAKMILVRVNNHRAELENAPELPWLKLFYPDRSGFLISLPDLLGINGAWQWYQRGVSYDVTGQKLHPFYGVYFPTRTEHLEMFDKWLSSARGRFTRALDIGTGCGILGFIMANQGIEAIDSTEINPNAVFSTKMDINRSGLERRFRVRQASFFGSAGQVNGLTVFNPPWIPGKKSGILDSGIYYDEGFFEQFFAEAEKYIEPGGTLAIIFSNYAIAAGITDHNPIERFVASTGKFRLAGRITAGVDQRSKSPSGSWINRIREKEKTELWVLQKE